MQEKSRRGARQSEVIGQVLSSYLISMDPMETHSLCCGDKTAGRLVFCLQLNSWLKLAFIM